MWPFKKRQPAPDTIRARESREAAEARLNETVEQTAHFKELGTRLREMRERNHFAESIRESMRPR